MTSNRTCAISSSNFAISAYNFRLGWTLLSSIAVMNYEKGETVIQFSGFLLTQNITYFTKKVIWDTKIEMPCVTGTRRIDRACTCTYRDCEFDRVR